MKTLLLLEFLFILFIVEWNSFIICKVHSERLSQKYQNLKEMRALAKPSFKISLQSGERVFGSSSFFLYHSPGRDLTHDPLINLSFRRIYGQFKSKNFLFSSFSNDGNDFDENSRITEPVEDKKSFNSHRFPRIYTPSECNRLEKEGAIINLDESQIHYLSSVMRLRVNHDYIRVFNGKDGEWLAKLRSTDSYIEGQDRKKHKRRKKGTIKDLEIVLHQKTRNQFEGPKVGICFAPLKNKDRVRFLLEKATELGVAKFFPIMTHQTDVSFNPASKMLEKMYANVIEAAEQCERLSIPQLYPLQTFSEFTSSWIKNDIKYDYDNTYCYNDNEKNDIESEDRKIITTPNVEKVLLACRERLHDDESLLKSTNEVVDSNQNVVSTLNSKEFRTFFQTKDKNFLFLVGPEGGFTDEEWKSLENLIHEQKMLNDIDMADFTSHQIKYMSLAPNILRAETAAISALSLWAYNTQNREYMKK